MSDPGVESIRPSWARSERFVPRVVLRPLQDFLRTSSASSLVLLLAAVVAMIWANSPWGRTYQDLWHTRLVFRVGGWEIAEDLRHWVNEGLMAFFFLLVGLEIKREVLIGELRDPKAVALPAIAALGGMAVPALIYLAFNLGSEGARGWGIPVATDIAFALGVLTMAARAAPPGLKPFLLTLAIVDDIGAIIIIGVAYSQGMHALPLASAVLLCAAIAVLQRIGVRFAPVYLALGFGVWTLLYASGVHPTIGGVALGLLTPALPFQRPGAVGEEAVRTADETVDDPSPPDADAHLWLRLAWLSKEAVSPLARVEHLLLPWTSFLVIPLFALANAGVSLSPSFIRSSMTSTVTLGIAAGLVVGKFLGIAGASWIGLRLGIGRLPEGLGFHHVWGVAAVAGVGFTVALFVAELAFPASAQLDNAKLGIVAGSLVSAVVATITLRSRRLG